MNADHSSICKFGASDRDYELAAGIIAGQLERALRSDAEQITVS